MVGGGRQNRFSKNSVFERLVTKLFPKVSRGFSKSQRRMVSEFYVFMHRKFPSRFNWVLKGSANSSFSRFYVEINLTSSPMYAYRVYVVIHTLCTRSAPPFFMLWGAAQMGLFLCFCLYKSIYSVYINLVFINGPIPHVNVRSIGGEHAGLIPSHLRAAHYNPHLLCLALRSIRERIHLIHHANCVIK